MFIKASPNKVPHPNSIHGKILEILRWEKSIVAGGFARWCMSPIYDTPPPGDVDIFCPNTEAFKKICEVLDNFLSKEIKKETEFTVEYGLENTLPIQIIKPDRFSFETVEGLLEQFDMSVVQAALYNGSTGLVGPKFYDDERNKIVRLNPKVKNLLGFIHRLQKYVRVGYTIDPECILEINKILKNSPEIIDNLDLESIQGYFR